MILGTKGGVTTSILDIIFLFAAILGTGMSSF